MTTDIVGNGGNMFELFNGLNGWDGMPTTYGIRDLGCGTDVIALFNATSTDLLVTGVPTNGTSLGEPGFNLAPSGSDKESEGATTFELRPYGYLPMYVIGGLNAISLDVGIYDEVFSSSSAVLGFSIAPGFLAIPAANQDGYSFSPSYFNQQYFCYTTTNQPRGYGRRSFIEDRSARTGLSATPG